jgi:transcriptional regulator with XRE-family HTH domain
MAKAQLQRITLGLKIRQFRQEKGWNFDELSRRTGISTSYLNEIEKGKKYPQPANLRKLAAALDVTPDFLTSPELTKQLAPLGQLLQSNFLNELPLERFGIELQQVVEIIARAPDRVNAFISALLEIARNYALRDEHFFFSALRAYQELRMNYFEEVENAAEEFVRTHHLPDNGGVAAQPLADLLIKNFAYRLESLDPEKYPELQNLRTVFVPKRRRLLLNPQLNERQRAFYLAKELGFNVLQLRERPLCAGVLRVNTFEEALNNYLATYFSVAVLINRHAFVRDVGNLFNQTTWSNQRLQHLISKYQTSPEVLFQRFNLLSQEFGLSKMFFVRVVHDLIRDQFEIDKELHLNRGHEPQASGLNEHYCRRWISPTLLRELENSDRPGELRIGVQRARFMDTDQEYLCIAVAKYGHPTPNRNVSVTIGIQLDEHAKRIIRFWNDPDIPRTTVNVTCERCPLADCRERAAEPEQYRKKEARRQMLDTLRKLTSS